MDVIYRTQSLRVQAAGWRKVLSRVSPGVYRVALLFLAVASIVAWLLGSTAGALLSAALFLMVLQIYAWWELYVRELPAAAGSVSDRLVLHALAEPDLLRCIESEQTPKQLWSNLAETWQLRFITNRLLLDGALLAELIPSEQTLMDDVWRQAYEVSQRNGSQSIRIGTVALALLRSANLEAWLAQQKLTFADVENVVKWQIRIDDILIKLQQKRSFGGIARDWASGYTPLLNRFGHNLSEDIERGVYQHLYLQSHSQELDHVNRTLSQENPTAVALVGGTGIGKTSLAYTFAEQLLDPSSHSPLKYYKVFSINAALVASEAKQSGNLESLLLHIVSEARRAKNIILFFDDASHFFGEGSGGVDATSILLQLLRASSTRMIFAFKPQDWQYLDSIASDVTVQVNQVVVQEPERIVVEKILQDQSLAIEAEAKSTITYQAIKEAYDMADRYMSEQSFPGKGISILQTAARAAPDGWVTPAIVDQVAESMFGVKVAATDVDESDKLLNLEEDLHQYMINQDYAVSAVADALRRARAGVRNPERPIGSFLFLGPTGVGKTELTKALARVYFGGAEQIVRVDMSEYSRSENTDRFIASSAHAGSFLGQVRQRPFSIILLDEIEKSSSEIQNLLLQLLDEGHLTDTDDRTISFKDAIIIATSNAGADTIRRNIESGSNLEDFQDQFIDELIDSQQYKPELINRFDEIVLFRPLDKQELRQVARLLIAEINTNLDKQQISIELTDEAVDLLIEEGYDPRLGARPMRRVIQRRVESVIAKRVLSQSLQPGTQLELTASDLRDNTGTE